VNSTWVRRSGDQAVNLAPFRAVAAAGIGSSPPCGSRIGRAETASPPKISMCTGRKSVADFGRHSRPAHEPHPEVRKYTLQRRYCAAAALYVEVERSGGSAGVQGG